MHIQPNLQNKAQTELNEIWKEKIKKSGKDKVDNDAYQEINDSLRKIVNRRKSSTITSFCQETFLQTKTASSL